MGHAAVLPFPVPPIEAEDSEIGGGDGENYTFRMVCPRDGCGSRMFHIHMEVDPDNKRVEEVWYACANCGDAVGAPDTIDTAGS